MCPTAVSLFNGKKETKKERKRLIADTQQNEWVLLVTDSLNHFGKLNVKILIIENIFIFTNPIK